MILNVYLSMTCDMLSINICVSDNSEIAKHKQRILVLHYSVSAKSHQ